VRPCTCDESTVRAEPAWVFQDDLPPQLSVTKLPHGDLRLPTRDAIVLHVEPPAVGTELKSDPPGTLRRPREASRFFPVAAPADAEVAFGVTPDVVTKLGLKRDPVGIRQTTR